MEIRWTDHFSSYVLARSSFCTQQARFFGWGTFPFFSVGGVDFWAGGGRKSNWLLALDCCCSQNVRSRKLSLEFTFENSNIDSIVGWQIRFPETCPVRQFCGFESFPENKLFGPFRWRNDYKENWTFKQCLKKKGFRRTVTNSLLPKNPKFSRDLLKIQ